MESSQLARTHLQLNDPETNRFAIQLVNPTTYSEVCNKARTEILRIQSFVNERRPASEAKTRCASKIARVAKPWITFWKTLSLHAVISDGEVIVAEPFKTLAFGAARQPTFLRRTSTSKLPSNTYRIWAILGNTAMHQRPQTFSPTGAQ